MKRPQLTLRDLFWLVIVVGLAVGWWLEHREYQRVLPAFREAVQQRTAMYQQLDELGYDVYVDASLPDGLTVLKRKPVYLLPGSPLAPGALSPPSGRIGE